MSLCQAKFFGFTVTGTYESLKPYVIVDSHPISAVIKGAGIGYLANKALDVLNYTGGTAAMLTAAGRAVAHIPVQSTYALEVLDLVETTVGKENAVRAAIYCAAIGYKFITRMDPGSFYNEPFFSCLGRIFNPFS